MDALELVTTIRDEARLAAAGARVSASAASRIGMDESTVPVAAIVQGVTWVGAAATSDAGEDFPPGTAGRAAALGL